MKRDVPVPYRLPLLAAGFISLAFGIGAGWLRMGVAFPLPSPALAAMHGPLMVCGFLGTVIAMERAVAIGARWAYLGPLLAALGALALFMETATGIGASLMLLASAVLLTASASVFLRQPALYTATLLLGSVSWLAGNVLWVAGLPFMQLMPWWAGFLILTIAGERLELSRMLPPSRLGQAFFVGIITLLLVGAVVASIELPARLALFSAALVALALWLFRQDIARRTIRQRGLTRYIAACLLSGYGWLLAAGLIGLGSPALMPGTSYDRVLHDFRTRPHHFPGGRADQNTLSPRFLPAFAGAACLAGGTYCGGFAAHPALPHCRRHSQWRRPGAICPDHGRLRPARTATSMTFPIPNLVK